MSMSRLEFRAMGSNVLVVQDGAEADAARSPVPGWFEEWEQILSRFRWDSELTRVNTMCGSDVQLSEQFWNVLLAAIDAEKLTDGLVTPLVLPDLIRAGYDRSLGELEAVAPPGGAFPLLDLPLAPVLRDRASAAESLVLDPSERIICLPDGAGLDFGGSGKGWAATEAARRLTSLGPCLVSAGGDIAVSGPRLDGGPWQIDVQDPFSPGHFVESFYIMAGGVATSGRDRRHWQKQGHWMHHVIDPRVGEPALTDIVTATVITRTAVEAEALAKAVLILGSKDGLSWLERIPGAAALLVLQSGDFICTRSFDAYLQ